jgi:Domain of unknown function (DUF5615)
LIRGLLRKQPDIDIVRVQDVGLLGMDDPSILEWAASHQRILITYDVQTMTGYAYERVAAGKAMPGAIALISTSSVGQSIDELLTVIGASSPEEWQGKVLYLPL